VTVLNAGLEVNKWDLIFDFTTKDSGTNFEFLPPEQFKVEVKELEGLEGDPKAV